MLDPPENEALRINVKSFLDGEKPQTACLSSKDNSGYFLMIWHVSVDGRCWKRNINDQFRTVRKENIQN